MDVVKITPRGYCRGVVEAINKIKKLDVKTLKHPITILGMVIHNKQVVEHFKHRGIKTLHAPDKTRLELLDQINQGTVIFTAHGVSQQVIDKARLKGLDIIDTTCDDVVKSQDTMHHLIDEGYDVIYIGKKQHPESEAAKALSPRVHVVETKADLKQLSLSNQKVALTNQTTMSLYDVFALSEHAKTLYDSLVVIDEICNATRIRQEAIENQPPDIEHCFVVGDTYSNNSNKLVEVSKQQAHIPASLIESVEDIDVSLLKTMSKVSVSSGASTPTKITNEVITFLKNFDKNNPSTHDNTSQVDIKTIIPN
ncbi:MAG: 4-hydroxy-3-methylbut-2-enyl diphosphate reductase [Candidatus Izimaplasma sp.]|nr:4-hydroxy-3-methylbut-2-enyl diphosphate reductase [Candidatus Izimaplasma bacterium]